MSKELIVSVKDAKKEMPSRDERVTEFYIERVDENHGIVGNIYKDACDRVDRYVQSGFVDIGLERDAFLYVSTSRCKKRVLAHRPR